MKPKFGLGRIVVKQEAADILAASCQDKEFFLDRHVAGNWGEEDSARNEQGLREGNFVLSRHRTLRGEPLAIITFLRTQETFLYRGPNFGEYYLSYPPWPAIPPTPEQFTYTISDSHGSMPADPFTQPPPEDQNDE